MDGEGVWTDSDGCKYEGGFKKGFKEGFGTKTKHGKLIYEGYMIEG
jgi:hypothetical protein